MQISRSRHATASSTQPKTILSRAFATLVAPAVISMALLGGVSSAQAAPVTIGNPLVVGSFKDLAATTYVSEISFGVAATGAELSTWSIFAHSGTVGRNITPLLLELVGGANYALRAIGQTHTIASTGVNTGFAFNVHEGSAAITGSNFFFGWKDGTQTSANQGVISFGGGASLTVLALTGNPTQNITGTDIGSSLEFGKFLGNRSYAFQATATAAVPEPGMLAVFGLGLIGLGLARRRRSV